MEGTLTLPKTAQGREPPAAQHIVQPIPKAAPKKSNLVVIAVYIEGAEHFMQFSVPLSSSLMSGQKTKESLVATFTEMLSERFGRVVKL